MIRRARWPLVGLAVCLAAGLYASGVRLPFLSRGGPAAVAEPVPDGDREMAWIHTTTAGTTWERFVSGVKRAELLVPGLHVDDSLAFPETTTAVPEVLIGRDGHAGRLRIRWYKLTSEATAGEWVRAFAARRPAPLALIGGGSSDRAVDLARALAQQTAWEGDRPLLLLTTATADTLDTDPNDPSTAPRPGTEPQLIDVYDDRSYRFCFTNRQMAEAVTDFVLQDPSLRPGPVVWPGLRAVPAAAAGPWAALAGLADALVDPDVSVYFMAWQDDPYSKDLCNRFKDTVFARLTEDPGRPRRADLRPSFHPVDFSVGRFLRPNQSEAVRAREVAAALPPRGQRGLLVIPTVAPPARRILRTLADEGGRVNRRLVAVTGDGIPVNTIYRDADFAWPVRTMPIPLVMFTHSNPFGWDEPGGPTPPAGYELRPPTSTEDVLHFAELARTVGDAAFPAGAREPVARADELAARLRRREPPFFDPDGNRLGGTGEYVVVLRPNFDAVAPGADRPDGHIEVYRRGSGRAWVPVRSLPVGHDRRPDGRAE